MATIEDFEAWPALAVELILHQRGTRWLQAFPFCNGPLPRKRLQEMGLLGSHGWPNGRTEQAADMALPVADRWAQKHGAATFEDFMSAHLAKQKP